MSEDKWPKRGPTEMKDDEDVKLETKAGRTTHDLIFSAIRVRFALFHAGVIDVNMHG